MNPNAPIYISVAGLVTLIFGIICSSLIFPKLVSYLINKETALVEGAHGFDAWKKPPFPFSIKVYFFNVTNPEEVQEGGNPILKELGPWVYDEIREHKILKINEENDTIKYTQKRFYYFNQKESGCRSDDDVVTILNIGAVTTAIKINNLAPMILPMVNRGIPYLFPGIKDIFITTKVRNILFDGMLMSCESEKVETICAALKDQLPPTVRIAENERDYLSALFYHINGTEEGPFEIERGIKNTIKGRIIAFEDYPTLGNWEGDFCNEIRGSDLTVNPSYTEPPLKLDFFAPDLCRSLSVDYNESKRYEEIDTYFYTTKYTFGEEQSEKCFCPLGDDDERDCPPTGTMILEPCAEVPIIISQPHFMNANPNFLKYAQGLHPDSQKHNSLVIIEPKTGVPLVVKIRVQMNVGLIKIPEIELLQTVSEGLFPFMWIETGAELPPKLLDQIRSNFAKLVIFDVLKYILMFGGALLILIALILGMVKDRVACFQPKSISRSSIIPNNLVASEIMHHNVKYPGLYPQLQNKNIVSTISGMKREKIVDID